MLAISCIPARAQNDYVVGAQDVLTITVFGEPELSGRYTVELDGTFTYPQLGRITAGGQTLRALEAQLKAKLAEGFLRNPQVAVAVETYRSQRILIMGEVRNPGEYQLTGEMTLLSALVRAQRRVPRRSGERLPRPVCDVRRRPWVDHAFAQAKVDDVQDALFIFR